MVRDKLRADDGTLLEVKEAVVLGPEEFAGRRSSHNGPIRVWKNGWLFMIPLIVILPLLALAGFTVISFFLAITLSTLAIRFLKKKLV